MAKKAPVAAKKASKAGASTKSASKAPAKPAPKAEKTKEAKAAKVTKASPVPAPAKAKKAEAVAPAKTSQPAESAEKIKVDKNMTEDQVKWVEMYNKNRDAQVANYDMKATFKSASALMHKVLGWGWIVSNENDRLEVLFKDGKRMLISNYRG